MIFTIAIPTYRRNDLLQKAVLSAVNQDTIYPYEVLIIDNDPSSNFDKILPNLIGVNKFAELRYIRNASNIGMFGNWNECIKQAKGKWLTILSDDDLLHPQYLKIISKYLSHDISCIAVGKKDFVIGEDHALIYDFDQKECAKKVDSRVFKIFNPVGTPAGFAFKKELALNVGGYDEEFYPSADYHFAKKIIKHGDFVIIKGVYAFIGNGVNESINVKTLMAFRSSDMKIRDISPQWLNRLIGVLNIIEQARKFRVYPSNVINCHRRWDMVLINFGSIFRVIKRVIFEYYSRSYKIN